MASSDDNLRPDYDPGKHDPWTGKDLPPEKWNVPEQYGSVKPVRASISAAKRSPWYHSPA